MTQWQWALFDIAIVVLESFLFYWYVAQKFECRWSGMKRWVIMAVFPITAYVLKLFQVKSATVTAVVLFVVGSIVVLVLYRCTVLQSILWNSLYGILLLMCESMSKGIFVFLIFYYLADGYFSYQARKRDRLLVQMKNEKIISDYEALERSRQNVYKLYHDLKKHLSVIQMMDHKSEAEQYVAKCFESIQDMDGKFETGSRYLDMFLYSEWKKARELGIKAQFAVQAGSLEQIELYDMIVILGNALENAREACKKRLEKKETACMQLKTVRMGGQVLIVVSNQYSGKLVRKDNAFVSNKENRELHGIGMKSMEDCVRAYEGDMNVSLREEKFILEILLNVLE